MKRSQVSLFGTMGIVAIAAFIIASPIAFNEKGSYEQKKLSILQEKSAEDAKDWMTARYLDFQTGVTITAAKLNQIEQAVKNMPTSTGLSLTWAEQGPDNVGGRTRAILIDRTNQNRIYAGGASGGLFVSTNGGNVWSKVDAYSGSKFISSMTQTQNGTIVVATGSSNDFWAGNGAWYSSDFGTTWNSIPGSETEARISEVVCSDNSNKVYLACSSGLKTWTVGAASLTSVTTMAGGCSSLSVSKDGSTVVAGVALNTFASTDSGASFTKVSGTGAGKVAVAIKRAEYAISAQKNSTGKHTVYATLTDDNLQGMFVSKDGGQVWEKFVGASGAPSSLNIYNNQGSYNSIITVDPTDDEAILIGGLDIWKWKQNTSNPISGGFEKVSQWFVSPNSPSFVHADNHEMKWSSNNKLYVGNDGGIGISNDFGSTWYPANRGYNIAQFYGIAFDRNGSVMGGTQDNGTIYNNHTLSTYKEFRELTPGDGFECEISFYNPKVMFTTGVRGQVNRSSDGVNFESFKPSYPVSYGSSGDTTSFAEHTEIFLAEYYDVNAKDSVLFQPNKDYAVSEIVKIPSKATGDTITYTTPTALYFDDTVNHKASLTEDRVLVKNELNNQNVLLGNYNYTHTPGSSQNDPPEIGDTLLVEFDAGDDTVIVDSVGSYKFYFSQHPLSSKIIELGLDSIRYNVAWDTLKLADPYQSWFFVYAKPNGGEIWGTRDALRVGNPSPKWTVVAKNFGGDTDIDMDFSADLNHVYFSNGSEVRRIDGLGDVYSSDTIFRKNTGWHGGVTTSLDSVAPLATTITTVHSGPVSGIALNPADEADLLVLKGNLAPDRSINATSGSPTFTALSSIASTAPLTYDAIIDRDDENIIIVGTHIGVFTSDDGGSTWAYNSQGFEGTPVFEIRQSTRAFTEGNSRPGEIHIGTHGRGIWSSSSLLGLKEFANNSNKVVKNKMTAFPNPTMSSTSLNFDLNQAGNAIVKVYSITGKNVKTVNLTNVKAGNNKIDIQVQDLPTGTYIVKLVAGSQIETTKFIKR
ncbi:MAG: photosystem II stability/assembly factor-like uncharacterized protein [Lentimonas sp.]|jgi:photosystem II stability/assembly factor-like uncharacterized protein